MQYQTFFVKIETLEPRQLLAEVGGSLSVDTVWSEAESPYLVVDDVKVEQGATLTIEPGVEMNFRNGARS